MINQQTPDEGRFRRGRRLIAPPASQFNACLSQGISVIKGGEMDVLLFRPEDMRRLYNCSTYDVNDIPLEKRIHPLIGLSFIGLALFYEVMSCRYLLFLIFCWTLFSTSPSACEIKFRKFRQCIRFLEISRSACVSDRWCRALSLNGAWL